MGYEPDFTERRDEDPSDVELPLAETVASRVLERVVVVVPTFSKRQEAYPPVVPRLIARPVRLLAPQVGSRVDKPSHVIQKRNARPPPAQGCGSAHRSTDKSTGTGNHSKVSGQVREVVLLQVAVERLLGKVSHLRNQGEPTRHVGAVERHQQKSVNERRPRPRANALAEVHSSRPRLCGHDKWPSS
eukprot:scaffold22995_cov29-Tisochrysis_lutea.AAC.1